MVKYVGQPPYLNLSFNEFKELDFSSDNLVGIELESLDVSKNELQKLNFSEQRSMNKFRILNASWNLLTEVILEKTMSDNLEKLYLHENKLTSLKFMEKRTFQKLTVLSLSNSVVNGR